MFVKERFHLDETIVEEIYDLVPDFGYNGFGEFVFYRTYSRQKPDSTMETWNDVVKRVVEGTFSIRKDHYLKNHIEWDEDFWQHYARQFALSMFDMKWLPPGRGLWAMGTDFIYERGSMALNNCGYVHIGNNIGAAIDWMMDALMCGVGVGFSIGTNELTVYRPSEPEKIYTIDDSREGWCYSTRLLINSYLEPLSSKIKLDYSLIRPAGAHIKGFGGLCSGPGPLIEYHKQIRQFFEMYMTQDWYTGTHLRVDLANACGCCVVAGNVRRSAELALGSINDPDFLDLKDYSKNLYRAHIGWMSNNSVVLENDEDFERLDEIAERVKNSGDPGICNLRNFPKGRIGKDDQVKPDLATGINPCQIYDAPVLTPKGIKKIGEIKIGDTIWSEHGWTKVINHQCTGIKPVYKYTTTAGCFYGTENHKVICDGMKIPVGKAYAIDTLKGPPCNKNIKTSVYDILTGLLIGDGTYDKDSKKHILYISKKDRDYFTHFPIFTFTPRDEIRYYINYNLGLDPLPKTYLRKIPNEFLFGDIDRRCNFLRGLYSANGSVVANRVQLKASSFKIIEQVQMMLSSLGIQSYWTRNKKHTVKFKNGYYDCKTSYDLNITYGRDVFYHLIGFIQEYKNIALRKSIKKLQKYRGRQKETFEIIEIEHLGDEPVYSITVDQPFHTYWSGGLNVANCGEQPLENYELCTLAETLPTRCIDHNDWLRACEYATFYASTVTLLPTHRPETNRIIARNRRIGVGIIDVSGWKYTVGANKVIKYLRKGYERIRKVNQWLAAEAGIPESIRVTTVKPGGTVPKLAGRTPGIGHPTFHYTLRRVRVAINSPIVPILQAAKIPFEPDVNDSSGTLIFEWPIEQGPAKPASQVTLWEQALNVIMMQREWSDNAVSNTLSFRPKWVLIRDLSDDPDREIVESTDRYSVFNAKNLWVTDTYDKENYKVVDKKIYKFDPRHEEDDIESLLSAIAPQVKSISLLPQTPEGVYPQMPESGITREEYERRIAAIKPIDWSVLTHHVAEPDLYCSSVACEVPK